MEDSFYSNDAHLIEGNAMRHTLWQAILVRVYGVEVGMDLSNSHEYDPFVNTGFRRYKNQEGADQTADILNNKIGISIAVNNKGATNKEFARDMLEYYKKYGLFEVSFVNGGYEVHQVKLTDREYVYSNGVLNSLNEKGKYDK